MTFNIVIISTYNNEELCAVRAYAIQEIPAVADKPARRESMPKIAPIRRAYNVVADNGLSSFVWLLLCLNSAKFRGIL